MTPLTGYLYEIDGKEFVNPKRKPVLRNDDLYLWYLDALEKWKSNNIPVQCAVCKSTENVKFLTITDCHLCEKCDNELAKSFEMAMCVRRDD